MRFPLVEAPWHATLTPSEYGLTSYFLLLAGLALIVGLIRAWATRTEVGTRYRTAVVARMGIMTVSALSYLVLIVAFQGGYTLKSGMYEPNSHAVMAFAPRYVEWSISVPLLVIELLAICVIAGPALRRARVVAASSAFIMIFLGFLGAVDVGDGGDLVAMLILGGISCGFWVLTSLVLIRAVRRSLPLLTTTGAPLLRTAATLLLSGWVVYPIVYVIQILAFGGEWSTVIQVTLCVADVGIKLGVGGVVHRVAKLRTAEDVRAGNDIHPEAIWISSEKQSDAGVPREVYLAPGAAAHEPRSQPATLTAVASESVDDLDN